MGSPAMTEASSLPLTKKVWASNQHPAPATLHQAVYHSDPRMLLLQLDAAGRGKRARRQINYAAESPSVGAGRSRASGSNVSTPLSSPDSTLRRVNGAAATPMVSRCRARAVVA